MQQWIKPSGKKITLNEDPLTIAKAKSLGWKLVDEDEKPAEVKEENFLVSGRKRKA